MNNIQSLLNLSPVIRVETQKKYLSTVDNYLDYFALVPAWKKFNAQNPNIIKSTTRLGFEIEMEKVPNLPDAPPLWAIIKDDSLRNSGLELISDPLPDLYIKKAFFLFQSFLHKIAHKNPDFSWRTSIHIHCNTQDMPLPKFLFALRLYLIFESVFYAIAGQERDASNFCVPLKESNLDELLTKIFLSTSGKTLSTLISQWPKYTGLSLFRMLDLGTVEFRHFPGSENWKELSIWTNMILCWYNAAMSLDIDIMDKKIRELNTSSEYREVFSLVFKDVIPFKDKYQDLMEQGVVFLKRCLHLAVFSIDFEAKPLKE